MSQMKIVVMMLKEDTVEAVLEEFTRQKISGWTAVKARGTGLEDKKEFLGWTIEPEKEVILSVVEEDKVKMIEDIAKNQGEINKPGQGILVSLDVEHLAGLT